MGLSDWLNSVVKWDAPVAIDHSQLYRPVPRVTSNDRPIGEPYFELANWRRGRVKRDAPVGPVRACVRKGAAQNTITHTYAVLLRRIQSELILCADVYKF